MNRSPFTNPRFSVNSSLATLKNYHPQPQEGTATKNIQSRRFSYQDVKQHQHTLQKENVRINANQVEQRICMNHPHQSAQYSALESTDDPMYLCERCAILVASKGFQISKIQEKKQNNVDFDCQNFKNSINETFNSIKSSKSLTIQKLNAIDMKLQKKQSQIQQYFIMLHNQIESKRQSLLKEVIKCRRQLQAMKHEANRYYIMLLEKVKQISKESTSVPIDIASQFTYYLQELAKSTFKIPAEKVTFEVELTPISDVLSQLNQIICATQGKEIKAKPEFKTKCEKDNSSIRSLQLSFDEDNGENTKREQEVNGRNVVESGLSSNLLSSIGLF